MNHSTKQLVLLYQVYSIWCLYNELIFLIYLHLLQVMNHSLKQLILLYQVYSIWCLYNEIDLPSLTIFTTGSYSFNSINQFSLESKICWNDCLSDLPSLTSFIIGFQSFYLTDSFTLRSNHYIYLNNNGIDLSSLISFTTGNYSFYETSSFTLDSISFFILLSSRSS